MQYISDFDTDFALPEQKTFQRDCFEHLHMFCGINLTKQDANDEDNKKRSSRRLMLPGFLPWKCSESACDEK